MSNLGPGRRMSLKEISRTNFTTTVAEEEHIFSAATPSASASAPSSPSRPKTVERNFVKANASSASVPRRASVSAATQRRLSMSMPPSSASANRRKSVAATPSPSTPSTPAFTAYSSRAMDKLHIKCDNLELELETMRKESARREEDLRKMLREAKVDAKGLSNKLGRREESLSQTKGNLEQARSRIAELEAENKEAENKQKYEEEVREWMEKCQDAQSKAKTLQDRLAEMEEQNRSKMFEEKRQREMLVIEGREKELEHLRDLEQEKQKVNEGVKREMDLQDKIDEQGRDLKESVMSNSRLEKELEEERRHSNMLEQDLEVAEGNLMSINQALKGLSQQQDRDGGSLGHRDLVQQSRDLQEAEAKCALLQKKQFELDTELVKERYFHAEDLSETVVERAMTREMVQQNQQRILGVLRAMRSGMVVAQTKLEEYVQAKATT